MSLIKLFGDLRSSGDYSFDPTNHNCIGTGTPDGRIWHCHRSADFQVCCVAGFQTRGLCVFQHPADLEVGDTAGLETCATSQHVSPNGGGAKLRPRRVGSYKPAL